MNITWVQIDDAPKVWDAVEPMLASAMQKWLPLYRSADLLNNVLDEKMQLWIITSNEEEKLYGAGLTEINPYPLMKMLTVYLFGGVDMNKWKDKFASSLELFARTQGCECMQMIGRRGWARFPGAFEAGVVSTKILI